MTTPRSEPHRVQLSRAKGWRKPENTVVVARPSKFGNPYSIEMMQKKIDTLAGLFGTTATLNAREMAVEAFRCDLAYGPDSPWWWYGPHMQMITIKGALPELKGKDLACWCPLDQPCHADVLLELANGGA